MTDQERIWEQMKDGGMYPASHPYLLQRLEETREPIGEFNDLRPSQVEEQRAAEHNSRVEWEMKRRIVVACDSFKGSLSSLEAGMAVKEGIGRVFPAAEVVVVPVADGGEGTVSAIVEGQHGRIERCSVEGPLGEPVSAAFGLCGDTAVIEMSQASGLTLVPPEKRNPLLTSSRGTGMLIARALEAGCRRFLIGLGGSATNDGGAGMLQALGFRFLDSEGRDIAGGGAELARVASISPANVNPLLEGAEFTVACDVTNPLTGVSGASRIFGPQKGAAAEAVEVLEAAMMNYARVAAEYCGRDLSCEPGAGAAGGLGFAFRTFLGASLRSGVDIVLDAVGFDDKLSGASLVITGEGRLDGQTCMGKAPGGVLRRASARGIPVIAIGGAVDSGSIPALLDAGFKDVMAATPADMPLGEAMRPETAARNLSAAAERII